MPAPRVLNRLDGSVLPNEGAIFLKDTLERRTARLLSKQISMNVVLFAFRGLSLTPPFSQIRISFFAAGFWDGKNQKKSLFSSSGSELMGSWPA